MTGALAHFPSGSHQPPATFYHSSLNTHFALMTDPNDSGSVSFDPPLRPLSHVQIFPLTACRESGKELMLFMFYAKDGANSQVA